MPEKILHPYEYRQKIKRRIKIVIYCILILAIGYFLFQNREFVFDKLNELRNSTQGLPSTLALKPNYNITEIELGIHDYVNEKRVQNGLGPIKFNEKLSQIARNHSEDMAKRNYFSHNDTEGRDFAYRYKINGFTCQISVGNYVYLGAENIFQNNLYNSITYVNGVPIYHWNTQDEIISSTVNGWMESEGHRKNILTFYWKSEGIGVSISSDDKVLITEDFC